MIGSGATAVTLVPAMAKQAAHVTMLQRSPTYIVVAPGARTASPTGCARKLPGKAGLRHHALEERAVRACSSSGWRARQPAQVKERLLGMVREHLGPDYDVETHFTPRYNPWDQRLCLVPDGDLFAAISAGKAEVVTDTIDRFMPDGHPARRRARRCPPT